MKREKHGHDHVELGTKLGKKDWDAFLAQARIWAWRDLAMAIAAIAMVFCILYYAIPYCLVRSLEGSLDSEWGWGAFVVLMLAGVVIMTLTFVIKFYDAISKFINPHYWALIDYQRFINIYKEELENGLR